MEARRSLAFPRIINLIQRPTREWCMGTVREWLGGRCQRSMFGENIRDISISNSVKWTNTIENERWVSGLDLGPQTKNRRQATRSEFQVLGLITPQPGACMTTFLIYASIHYVWYKTMMGVFFPIYLLCVLSGCWRIFQFQLLAHKNHPSKA